MSVNALDAFSGEQIDRARRYHRPLYRALALDLLFGIGVLSVLAFTGLKDPLVDGRGPLGAAAAVTGVWILVRLPLAFWRSYVYEKRWGFSTQTLPGWVADAAKGSLVVLVFMSGMVWAPIAFAADDPRWWPLEAGAAIAVFGFLVGMVLPPLLERLFNRFTPLADDELAASLRELAAEAGSPVRKILVADASRRTTKKNAYVSSYGPTRRLVLFDTLVDTGDPREIRLVLAHELAHRRGHHTLKRALLEILGLVCFLAALWGLYRWAGVLGAIGATSPGDARTAPFVLLAFVVGEVVALPISTGVSRRWEREADAFSLDLTKDPEAFESAHRDLADTNLSDLDPPRPLYVMLFTHPTPPERIAIARRWVEARAA